MSYARIGGAMTAAVLALALVWLAFETFGGERATVLPTISIQAPPASRNALDSTGPLRAERELADRSRLLGDRRESGSIGGVSVVPAERPSGNFTSQPGVADPRRLVRDWQGDKDAHGVLREPSMLRGTTSLPYDNANLLEQPQGRDWRRAHNGPLRFGGGWVILGMGFLLAAFLFWRGRIRIAEGPAGTHIERFSAIERANHWMTATAFILLALSGLVVIYGKPLLLPIMGASLFGDLALASVWIHMASAIPFVIGIVMMIALWLRENLPTRLDWEWLKAGGGFLHDDGKNPPARKFNAGQKIVFWGVVLGGLAALASGIALMFPFAFLGFDGMQWAQLIHAGIAIAMVALILGHIYIGTVGMEGAIDAMWSGEVDENWAKEHHSIWYRDVKAEEHRPPSGSRSGAHPAE